MRIDLRNVALSSAGLVCMLAFLFTACGLDTKKISAIVSDAIAEESGNSTDSIGSVQLIYDLMKYNSSLSDNGNHDISGENAENVIRATDGKSDSNMPALESLIAAYASAKGDITREDYALGVSCGLDSNATKVGILLEKFLYNIEKDRGNPTETPSNLSAVESDIVNSPEFKEMMEKVVDDPESLQIDGNQLSDCVMNFLVDAFSSCKDKEEVDNTVRFYTKEVKRCGTLSEDDKEILYASFAVAAYSYRFWCEK